MRADSASRCTLWLGLSLLLGSYVAVEQVLRLAGLTTLSGDDFFKFVIARRWSEDPFLLLPAKTTDDPWLPLFFWVAGPLFCFSETPWNTIVLLNNGLVVVALGALAVAGAKLGRTPTDGLWAAALAGFLSWTLWSANSFTEYPLFLCALSLSAAGLAAWLRTLGRAALWTTSLALLVTTLVRYEGWIPAASVGVVLVAGIRGASRGESLIRIGAAVVANLVPISTAAFNVVQGAMPLSFFSRYLSRFTLEGELSARTPWYLALIEMPVLLFLVAPVLLLLLPMLFVRLRRSGDRALTQYAVVVGLSLAGLTLLGASGFVPNAAPQRYVLWLVFLTVPLLPVLLHTSRRTWPVAVCFCLSAGAGLAFAFLNNRTQHHGMREAAQLVSGMPNIKTVASEALLRASLRMPAAEPTLYYQLLSQHAALSCFLSPQQRLPISVIPSTEFAQIYSRIDPRRPDGAARDGLPMGEPDAIVVWSSELLPLLDGRYRQVANAYNYKVLIKKELYSEGAARRTLHPRLARTADAGLAKAVGYDHSDYRPYVFFEVRREPSHPVGIVMANAQHQYWIPVRRSLQPGAVYTQEVPAVGEPAIGLYRFFLVHGSERQDLGEQFYFSSRRSAVGKLLTFGGDLVPWLRVPLTLF